MGQNKKLVTNLVFVWLGFATQVLTTFLLTPMMISKLGNDGYGLWIFLQSFTGYYGLIDMGLRAGVTQTITQRLAKGERESLLRYFNGVLPLLGRISIAVLFVGVAVGFLLSRTLTVSEELKGWVIPLAICQSAGIAFTMLTFPFSAVLPGLQRYDISETIAFVLRIATSACAFLVLLYAPSIIAISLLYLAFNILDQILRLVFVLKLVPELKHIRPALNRTEVKELFRVGGLNFVMQISHQLLHRFNAIQIAYMFSLAIVVPFNVANSMADHAVRVVSISTRVLYPAFAHMNFQDQVTATRNLLLLSTRLCVGFSLVVAFVGMSWMQPFLEIWLKNVNGKQEIISAACSYYLVFALINVATSIRGVGGQLLLGKDELRFMAKTMVVESVIAIVLSFAFSVYFGPIGIPLGNLVAFTLSIILISLPRVAKLVDLNLSDFYLKAFLRPIVYASLCSASVWVWRRSVTEPNTWQKLFTIGFIPTAIVCILFLPVLFSRTERESVCVKLQELIRSFSLKFAKRL
jgi:O-antigen/teichoic acid export membrane protein